MFFVFNSALKPVILDQTRQKKQDNQLKNLILFLFWSFATETKGGGWETIKSGADSIKRAAKRPAGLPIIIHLEKKGETAGLLTR